MPDTVLRSSQVMDRWAQLRVFIISAPVLLTVLVVVLIITFAILTFRMLMSLSNQFADDDYFNSSSAGAWGGLLNTIWISITNIFYQKVLRPSRALLLLPSHRPIAPCARL